MAGKVLKMNKIYKINGSVKMKVSAENSATAHTLDPSKTLLICPVFILVLQISYAKNW